MTMVTVEPETVQTDEVVEANVTALPLDEVADTENGASVRLFVAGGEKVIAWAAVPITSVGSAEDDVNAFARVPFAPIPQHDAEPSLPIAQLKSPPATTATAD